MGINCKILLHGAQNNVYGPGHSVSGEIIYAIDKETVFKNITIYLTGKAHFGWTDNKRYYEGTQTFYNTYFDVLEKHVENTTLGVNSYRAPFCFILPDDIPSNFSDPYGSIKHKLKIKFTKASLINSRKIFSKEINVMGNVVPNINGSLIFGEVKYLTRLFTNNDGTINIKGILHKSVMNPKETISLDCETTNDTNFTIPRLKMRLWEKLSFISNDGVTFYKNKKIKGCKMETGPISKFSSEKVSPTIPIPDDICTIQHCRVFKREYTLKINAELPIPHKSINLKIPILIGEMLPDRNSCILEEAQNHPTDDPPSYWEVMNEEKEQNNKEKDEEF